MKTRKSKNFNITKKFNKLKSKNKSKSKSKNKSKNKSKCKCKSKCKSRNAGCCDWMMNLLSSNQINQSSAYDRKSVRNKKNVNGKYNEIMKTFNEQRNNAVTDAWITYILKKEEDRPADDRPITDFINGDNRHLSIEDLLNEMQAAQKGSKLYNPQKMEFVNDPHADSNDTFYPAMIEAVNADGTLAILFDNGDKEPSAQPEDVEFLAASGARGPRAGTKVKAKKKGWVRWLPHVVEKIRGAVDEYASDTTKALHRKIQDDHRAVGYPVPKRADLFPPLESPDRAQRELDEWARRDEARKKKRDEEGAFRNYYLRAHKMKDLGSGDEWEIQESVNP